MTDLDRRQFLGFGAASLAVALGGCSGLAGSDSSFTDWVPASGAGTLTAYVDFTVAQKSSKIDPILPLFLPGGNVSSSADLVPDLSALDEVDEPLLRLPLQTGGQVIGVSTLLFAASGLSYLVAPSAPAEGVTELFRANHTVIGTGDIDVQRANEALRTGDSDFLGEVEFEAVTDYGGYTVYTPTADVEGAVAVNEGAVLLAERQSQLQTVIDTRGGTAERAVDSSATFEWLFEVAGSADMLVGWLAPVQLEGFYWGPLEADPASDIVTQDKDVLSSVTFSPETQEIAATLALHDEDMGMLSSSELESQLMVDEREITVDEELDRVSATTTYTDEALDLQFVEPTDPPPETTAPGGDDLPPPVAEAVPANAFEFEFNEDTGVVRVNFVKEFEADRVTIRAVGTESEASTTTPRPVSFLSVYIAEGGDEVVVTVTVDGVTGEVARKSFGGPTSTTSE